MIDYEIDCPDCGGCGYHVVPAHDNGCHGECRYCPVPEMEMCRVCGGCGKVVIEGGVLP